MGQINTNASSNYVQWSSGVTATCIVFNVLRPVQRLAIQPTYRVCGIAITMQQLWFLTQL